MYRFGEDMVLMEKRRDLLQDQDKFVCEVNSNQRGNKNKALWGSSQKVGLRRDDLGHLSCINDDISHGESSDEDRGRNDSRDPGIMFS